MDRLQTAWWSVCLIAAGISFAAAPAKTPGETDATSSPLEICSGQSRIIDTPWPTERMSVTNPKVADLEAISPRQVLVLARKIGCTDLVMWSQDGQMVQRRIDVRCDLDRLRNELARLLPKTALRPEQSQDVIVVTGEVPEKAQYERLDKFLKSAQEATGIQHANMVVVRADPPPVATPPSAAHDPVLLQAELQRLFSDADLGVRRAGDVMIVTGLLRRAEQVELLSKLLAALEASTAEAAQRNGIGPVGVLTAASRPAQSASGPRNGLKFLNMTSLAGLQQVQLQVKVAEVSRTSIRALGINALWAGHNDNTFFGADLIGPDGGGALNPISIGPPAGALAGDHVVPYTFNADVNVSPLVTLMLGFPRADLQFFLQALAENQYLRILAEPNLVAMSGEEASFLAGGEFPIPVVQGATQGSVAITIEYKEFGVRLKFRPTVLGDGTIRLHVAPEVSDLTNNGAIEIQGFRVPALITRRAETTLELNSGQTFSMAGLLNTREDGRSSRTPGLGDVPVLGALFRSVRYQKGETELVVLVTASLVEPLNSVPATPGVLDETPNDWELYGMGQVEGRARPWVSDADARWLEKMGLDDLQGPGAWECYDKDEHGEHPASDSGDRTPAKGE